MFVSGLSLTTVYLEFSGYDWPVLGQVGPKLIIFDQVTGVILASFSGLFRASEIAAWHAMTAACFVVLMIFLRRITFTRLLTAVIVAALFIGIGVLTGRRKIVVEFAVFVSTYFILWVIFEKGVGKLAIIAVTGVALIGIYIVCGRVARQMFRSDTTQDWQLITRFTFTGAKMSFQDVPARFVELGIAPIMWAYDSFGLIRRRAGSWDPGHAILRRGRSELQGQRKAG